MVAMAADVRTLAYIGGMWGMTDVPTVVTSL